MATFSDFLEDELLDHVFGGSAYSAPANLFFALSTADPLDDASGLAEPGVGGYARVSVTNNLTEFPAASGGTKSNANDIVFPTATASFGTISHMAIFDALVGGNMLAHAPLAVAKLIGIGDTFRFPAGDVDISLD